MNIEIKINKLHEVKELYLFGDFITSWNIGVDDMKIIIPYAINCAVKIGEDKKANEIRKALNV